MPYENNHPDPEQNDDHDSNRDESTGERLPSEELNEPQIPRTRFQLDTPATPIYYDSARKHFLWKNQGNRWLAHAVGDIKRVLKGLGFSGRTREGESLSEIDQEILKIQEHHDVHYSGRLAGRSEGFYEENDLRILVTENPKLINPKSGEWPTLKAVLSGLLSKKGTPQNQMEVFCSWLKLAFEALQAGAIRPGQALALAGPPGCGKSLLQKLITQVLGGRSAKAYRALSGETQFNAELFEAEHLMLEDEQSSTDHRTRRKLAAYIKSTCVNEVQSCHRKQCTPVQLCPFWRLTISLNHEPEALLVLPPLDEDVADKIILLSCQSFELPMPTDTLAQREKFWRTLVAELPAFLAWLGAWQIPHKLRDTRYGVKSYHDPDMEAKLGSLSQEVHLLSLVDSCGGELWGYDKSWAGTASDLEQMLCGKDSPVQHAARRLLSWPGAAGTYLGRLAKKHPERVQSNRTSSRREWIIFAPNEEKGDGDSNNEEFDDDEF